jgi:hypothetical protein
MADQDNGRNGVQLYNPGQLPDLAVDGVHRLERFDDTLIGRKLPRHGFHLSRGTRPAVNHGNSEGSGAMKSIVFHLVDLAMLKPGLALIKS